MSLTLSQPLPPEQEQLQHLSQPFPSSFPSLLPRPHSGDYKQHRGDAADDRDSGDVEKSDRKQRPVRGLSARVSGAVHTGEAHSLSAAHAGHLVAGIRPLPHQAEVGTLSRKKAV